MVIVDNCRFGEKIEHRWTRADDTDPVSQEVVLDIGIGINCYFSFHDFYLPLNSFWRERIRKEIFSPLLITLQKRGKKVTYK